MFFLQIFAGEIGAIHRLKLICNFALFCSALFITLYNSKSTHPTNDETLDHQVESHNSAPRTAERSSIAEPHDLDDDPLDTEPLDTEENDSVQVSFICVVKKSVLCLFDFNAM